MFFRCFLDMVRGCANANTAQGGGPTGADNILPKCRARNAPSHRETVRRLKLRPKGTAEPEAALVLFGVFAIVRMLCRQIARVAGFGNVAGGILGALLHDSLRSAARSCEQCQLIQFIGGFPFQG